MLHMRKDTWASGDLYEPYLGRWSRLAAREFLTWLAMPPDRTWLDVGCGMGALTQVILEGSSPRSVVSVDPSEGYIAYARDHVRDNRIHFEVGDAQRLPFDAVMVRLGKNGSTAHEEPFTSVENVALERSTVDPAARETCAV